MLLIIQILIFIKEKLSKYYSKVKDKDKNLLDSIDLDMNFDEHCPLCGGRGVPNFFNIILERL